jgi:hypothetical protein
MARHLGLEIGGVRFSIEAGPGMRLHEPSRVYQAFLVEKDPDGEGAHIHITVQRGALPNTDPLQCIFDGGLSWSLFRDRGGFVISLKPPHVPEPLWVVSMDGGFTRGTLHCSDQILERQGKEIRVANPVCYPLDQIFLMNHLAPREGALMHAAGVNGGGQGVLFAGKSGAGKTALCRLLVEGALAEALSDDRMVVRREGEHFHAYGTPWPGELGVARNKGVPLRAVFFLHHGNENEIEPLGPRRALEEMMAVVSVPWYDEGLLWKTLGFCESLAFGIPQYELHFRNDRSVVRLMETWMRSRGLFGCIPIVRR